MRGKQSKKRVIPPDQIYGSVLVAKFINNLMIDGKKSIAAKMVYDALEKLAADTKMPALDAFERAFSNVRPKVEVRSRRVGGANYQVPVPVADNRQQALAMRWIINATRDSRGSKSSSDTLFNELKAAFNKEGAAVKKKEDTHKMAEANKAFSHLTW